MSEAGTDTFKVTSNAMVAALLLIAMLLLAAIVPAESVGAGLEDRDRDPIVLTGDSVPGLYGIDPDRLAAFRRVDGGWDQVPVQVDERFDLDYRTLYPFADAGHVRGGPVVINAYADPGTLAGADPNPAIDADDEVVMMASDAGDRVSASYGSVPEGMLADRATEVRVEDPLTGNAGFVYLFEAAGQIDQSAGEDYVDYDFKLLSGDYLSTYGFASGPNPEASRVETDFYSTGHSDRWIDDELRLKTPGASGVDILDREKAQFFPGFCGRSTDTFSSAEGSFIVNRDGPVRAIRSYIGANSGPYTQRESVFYRQRQDVRTFLRVHQIPQVMQFTDYSPEASGMTYRNALNPDGVTIDGQPDGLRPGLPEGVLDGAPTWEQVSGPQGSVDVITELQTDIEGLEVTNYYLDNSSPGGGVEVQCTGDAAAYGSSGSWISTTIPNTDPRSAEAKLAVTRTLFYEGPSATASRAETRMAGVESPLTASSAALPPSSSVDPPQARIATKLNKRRLKLRTGGKAKLRVWVKNEGGLRSGRIEACARVRHGKIRLAGRKCRSMGRLAPAGESWASFNVKARRNAIMGRRAKVRVTVRQDGRKVGRQGVKIRLR